MLFNIVKYLGNKSEFKGLKMFDDKNGIFEKQEASKFLLKLLCDNKTDGLTMKVIVKKIGEVR